MDARKRDAAICSAAQVLIASMEPNIWMLGNPVLPGKPSRIERASMEPNIWMLGNSRMREDARLGGSPASMEPNIWMLGNLLTLRRGHEPDRRFNGAEHLDARKQAVAPPFDTRQLAASMEPNIWMLGNWLAKSESLAMVLRFNGAEHLDARKLPVSVAAKRIMYRFNGAEHLDARKPFRISPFNRRYEKLQWSRTFGCSETR